MNSNQTDIILGKIDSMLSFDDSYDESLENPHFIELKKTLDYLKDKSQRKIEYTIAILIFGWSSLWLFVWLPIVLTIIEWSTVSPWFEILLGVLFLIIIPIGAITWMFFLFEHREKVFATFLAQTSVLFRKYKSWYKWVDDIDTILSRSKEVHDTLMWVYRFLRKNKGEFWVDLICYVKEIENASLKVLLNLQSDLKIRLIEREKDLIGVNASIKTNLPWNSGLNDTLKVQSARLDHQIKQFEVLQKVLIKI